MPLYPVLDGHVYTVGDVEYQPGDTVDLTEGQAAPWVGTVLGEAIPDVPAAAPVGSTEPKEEDTTNVG